MTREPATPIPTQVAPHHPFEPLDRLDRIDLDPAAGLDCLEDAIAAGIPVPCQTADPDLFFAEAPVDVERAKALCAACPIRELCLATALRRAEPWGVWGGEWLAAGRIATKRSRGRPRKNAA